MERRADEPFPDNWADAVRGDAGVAHDYEKIEGCAEIETCYFMIPNTGLWGGLEIAADFAELRGALGEGKHQADLLRDIFGNPFHPVTLDPRWLTSTTIDLARTIYEGFPRQAGGYVSFDILADALQDAGCDDKQILDHCRGPGPHVKGCWVVDLILGKS